MRPCNHTEPPDVTCIEFHTDALLRHARGEKQKRCKKCGRWIWSSLWIKKARKA